MKCILRQRQLAELRGTREGTSSIVFSNVTFVALSRSCNDETPVSETISKSHELQCSSNLGPSCSILAVCRESAVCRISTRDGNVYMHVSSRSSEPKHTKIIWLGLVCIILTLPQRQYRTSSSIAGLWCCDVS